MRLTCLQHDALQLNTKDILFICGGAFVNLDRLVAERTSTASLGFGNPVCPLNSWLTNVPSLSQLVLPPSRRASLPAGRFRCRLVQTVSNPAGPSTAEVALHVLTAAL